MPRPRRTGRLVPAISTIATFASIFGLSAAAFAVPTTDAANDFIGTYTGPQAGDLDVLSTNVTLLPTGDFLFEATLNASVGTTAGAFYVWGIDRGTGATTSNFASIGLPNVIFDSVVILRPDGTGQVNRQNGGGTSTLAAGSISIVGSTITGVVPGAFLPSTGFAREAYTYNLWPRLPGAADQISDFAPNTNNAAISTVPEAGAGVLALLGAAPLGGVLAAVRRRRRA
jgi:hypothetical protein